MSSTIVRLPYKEQSKINKAYWACYRWIRNNVFEPFRYRFFGHKHHIVKTGLRPSPWYDTDTRMLYAVMELVKWFVENDMRAWSKKDREEEIAITKINEFGLDPEILNESIKSLEDQWAKEDAVVEICDWGKNYKNKQKEIEESCFIWHTYVELNKNKEEDYFEALNRLGKEGKEKELRDRTNKLEEKLAQEETEMLKRAIELRGSMWS